MTGPLPAKPSKAIVAFVVALAAAVGTAASDGDLTGIELVIATAGAVVTGGGVYLKTNPPRNEG